MHFPILHHSRSLLLLLFLLQASVLAAQTPVKGKITDALSGTAIGRASVFINNTTYSRICDENGNFELDHFPSPPFELTITAIGYETMVLRINRSPDQPLTVKLQQKSIGLGEVTILSPEKDGWKKYGRQFMDAFIGYSEFATQCELLNKEVLEFRFDRDALILTVSATAPLQIRNKATGYEITYWLEDFEKNYSDHRLFYRGYALFTPLNSGKEKMQQRWREQRKSAYRGSLNHFMRSLYEGNTMAQGFEVRRLVRVKGTEYGRYAPVRTDTLTATDTVRFRSLLQELWAAKFPPDTIEARWRGLRHWLADSNKILPVKITDSICPADIAAHRQYTLTPGKGYILAAYYDYSRLPPDPFNGKPISVSGDVPAMALLSRQYDILFSGLLNPDSFMVHEQGKPVRLSFPGYFQVTYTKELEEHEFLARRSLSGAGVPEWQNSIISLNEGTELTIQADGNFFNPYDLVIENYWSYEKLDKLLPLDYRPE